MSSDDALRYCLSCSGTTGKLVPRYSPSLDRERAEKAGRAEARRRAKTDRERQAANDRRCLDAFDLERELKRLCCLPVFGGRTGPLAKHPPELNIRRVSKPQNTAVRWGHTSLVISVWPGRSAEHAAAWLLWGVVAVYRSRTASKRHQRAVLRAATDEAWPGLDPAGSDDTEFVQSLVGKLTASGLLTAPAAA